MNVRAHTRGATRTCDLLLRRVCLSIGPHELVTLHVGLYAQKLEISLSITNTSRGYGATAAPDQKGIFLASLEYLGESDSKK